ncbi:MAG: FHA domain-containing protein [Thermoanaerobaculia bacterium]
MTTQLQGDLGAFRLKEILLFLSGGSRTGTLRLMHEMNESEICLDSGAVVRARSGQETMQLPTVLTRRKKIDRESRQKLEAAMNRNAEGWADDLLKAKTFSAEALKEFGEVLASEVVYDALMWERGLFEFSGEIELPEGTQPVALKVDGLIAEGSKRIAEWEKCQKLFPDPEVVFRVVGDPESEKITLTADEFRVLFKIDGKTSLSRLVRILERDPIELYHTLDSLRKNALLEEVSVSTVTDAPIEAEAPQPEPAPEKSVPEEPAAAAQPAGDETVKGQSPQLHAPPPPMPMESSSAETIIGGLPLAPACLILHDENRTTFPLIDQEYKLGRDPAAEIRIKDSSVSSMHARLVRSDGGYVLEDTNSRNGSYVNGERITRVELKNNDQISLGKVQMVYNTTAGLKPSAKTLADAPK